MTDLKDRIITAVEIAEAAGTAVTMYPNQVRYLLDRIAELEAKNAALKVQLADREADLEFEYDARVEAEEEVEHLRDNADCEAGVLFDTLRSKLAELKLRNEELELQVLLLTPSYTEVTIIGSDHTNAGNYHGEGTA